MLCGQFFYPKYLNHSSDFDVKNQKIKKFLKKIAALHTLQKYIYSTKLVSSIMKYAEALSCANRVGGIVIKTKWNKFEVAYSFWDFALSIAKMPNDLCYYEIVSNKQCTYLDLDMKINNCLSIPVKLRADIWEMPRQCLKLLD